MPKTKEQLAKEKKAKAAKKKAEERRIRGGAIIPRKKDKS